MAGTISSGRGARAGRLGKPYRRGFARSLAGAARCVGMGCAGWLGGRWSCPPPSGGGAAGALSAAGAGQVGDGVSACPDRACGEGGPPPGCRRSEAGARSASPVRGRSALWLRRCLRRGFAGIVCESLRGSNRDSRRVLNKNGAENDSVGGVGFLKLSVGLCEGQSGRSNSRVPITSLTTPAHPEHRGDALHQLCEHAQHRRQQELTKRGARKALCV